MPNTKIINVLKGDSFADVFDEFTGSDAQEVIFIFPKGSKFARNESYFEKLSGEAENLSKTISIMTSDPKIAHFAMSYGLNILEDKQSSDDDQPRSTKSQSKRVKTQATTDDEEDDEDETPNISDIEITPATPPHHEPTEAEDEEGETDPEAPVNISYPDYSNIARDLDELFPSMSADSRQPAAVTQFASTTYDTIDQPIGADPEILLAASRKHQGKTVRDVITPDYENTVPIKQSREKPEEIFINVQKHNKKSIDKDLGAMWGNQEGDSQPLIKTRSHTFWRKIPYIFLGLALLALGFIAYTLLGSAQIIIKPQKQAVSLQIKVAAASDAASVNTEFNRIPGQRFTETDEVSDTFPASGQKEVAQKASGTITIYNKSSSAQRLVATTRFESTEGLIFRIATSINVPAASNGTPGSLKAEVYADRPGPEYNIPAGKFTIPGFKDTPRSNDFYATSDQPMAGGAVGPSKIVTDDDYAKALASLKEKLKTKIQEAIQSQASELKIITIPEIKIEEPTTNVKASQAADSLQMTLHGSAVTLGFRETDIKSLITSYVSKNSHLELIDNGLNISYQDPVLSSDTNTLSFVMRVSGQAAYHIDEQKIFHDILGMKESTIKEYFNGIKEIESARIILSPFWVTSVPKDPQKVKLRVEI